MPFSLVVGNKTFQIENFQITFSVEAESLFKQVAAQLLKEGKLNNFNFSLFSFHKGKEMAGIRRLLALEAQQMDFWKESFISRAKVIFYFTNLNLLLTTQLKKLINFCFKPRKTKLVQ